MLVDIMKSKQIQRTDRIVDYDAFIVKSYGEQILYIKIISISTSLYLKIKNTGEFSTLNICTNTTFELFPDDRCFYPVSIDSIKFDKVLYKSYTIEEVGE